MALTNNGQIAASDINTELQRSSSAQLSIGSSLARDLAGVSSGEIRYSDFHGAEYSAEYDLTIGLPSSLGGFTGYSEIGPGSLSPTTFNGQTIITLAYIDGDPNTWYVEIEGNHPQDFFSLVELPDHSVGYSFDSSNADVYFYSSSNNKTRWSWASNIFFGNDEGTVTPVIIHY